MSRIAHAQQMLAATSAVIVDLALRSGFQTQPQFTAVFKIIVGSMRCWWRQDQLNIG